MSSKREGWCQNALMIANLTQEPHSVCESHFSQILSNLPKSPQIFSSSIFSPSLGDYLKSLEKSLGLFTVQATSCLHLSLFPVGLRKTWISISITDLPYIRIMGPFSSGFLRHTQPPHPHPQPCRPPTACILNSPSLWMCHTRIPLWMAFQQWKRERKEVKNLPSI